MKKEYEAPVAEKLEFDYSEIVCASGQVTNKNPKQGCDVNESGQTMQNANKCNGSGTTAKKKKC